MRDRRRPSVSLCSVALDRLVGLFKYRDAGILDRTTFESSVNNPESPDF
jgi:hypothetical protein